MKRISIDPITRLEGHGKIDIFLDDQGDVANAYLQIPELRGFEQFCVGRPAEDMPNLTARICGVCPEAHHMAATKALDALFHVDPPPVAKKLRELFYSIFYATDHTTHFYALGGPDFVVGPTAPPAQRNILGVVAKVGMDVAKHVLENAARRPCPDPNDGRPPRASQLGPARRRQPRHQRGAAEGDRGPGTRGRRVRQVLVENLRRRRAGQLRLRQTHHRRHLCPQDLQHGHGRRQQLHELLRRQDSRHQPRRQGTRQVRLCPVPRVRRRAGRAVVVPEVPLPEEDRLEGPGRRRGFGRLQGHAAVALQRGRRHGHAAGQRPVQADVRNAGRQADQPHAGHALGPAGRIALCGRAVGRAGHRSADHRQGIPRAAQHKRRPTAWAASRPRAAR